jgi:hypothetical protein
MRSLAELGQQDVLMRGGEWIRLVRHFAGARGIAANALEDALQARAPQRVTDVLRAVVTAGSSSIGSPSAWGDELVGYRQLQAGFLESLRGRSAFFRMLSDSAFARMPLRTAIAFSTSNATAYIVGAGRPKPLTKLAIAASVLEPIKACALMVVTEELLRATGTAAEATFARELRGAVSDTVDAQMFEILGQGITPQAASANPYDDLEALLDVVNATAGGRMYWVMEPALANAMSCKVATDGNRLFPDLSPVGGTVLGLPALVSGQVPAAAGSPAAGNSLWLVDASQVAADAEGIGVRMSREASLEASDTPTGDAVTGVGASVTSQVNLWQENLVGLLAEVYFGLTRLRHSAVAVVEGMTW